MTTSGRRAETTIERRRRPHPPDRDPALRGPAEQAEPASARCAAREATHTERRRSGRAPRQPFDSAHRRRSWRSRAYFAARDNGYDTAPATLDLAVVLAERGRTAEVRGLARQMEPIFRAQRVHREGSRCCGSSATPRSARR